MFNRSKALIAAFVCGFKAHVMPSIKPDDVDPLLKPKHSRGKSGKSTAKPSGAAAFKRAAKKRNNIRKHS